MAGKHHPIRSGAGYINANDMEGTRRRGVEIIGGQQSPSPLVRHDQRIILDTSVNISTVNGWPNDLAKF
jgi:hypothetical protein